MEAGRAVAHHDPGRARRRHRRGAGDRAAQASRPVVAQRVQPELRAEGFSRLTYLLEPQGEMVKLTVTHEIDRPQSKLIEAVSGGWPLILASLKSLLETGESLEATRQMAGGR